MSRQIKMISPEGVTLKTAGKYIKEDIYISNDLPEYNGENESGEIAESDLKTFLTSKGCSRLFYNFKGTAEDVENLIPYDFTENIEDFSYMFESSSLLRGPLLSTKNGKKFNSMFLRNSNLNEVPDYDFSNATVISTMFFQCSKLVDVSNMEKYEMPNVTSLVEIFSGCTSLEKIPLLKTGLITNINNSFVNCNKVSIFPAYDFRKCTTTAGAFYKCSGFTKMLCYGMCYDYDISYSILLDAEALVLFFSNCQVITKTRTLTLGSTLLSKLENVYVKETGVEQYEGITCRPCVICESTDEGAMLATEYITAKGWTLA